METIEKKRIRGIIFDIFTISNQKTTSMKKLVILFTMLLYWTGFSQTATTVPSIPDAPKFQWGIQVGATSTNVTVDLNNLNDLPKQGWGYQAGLVTRHNFMEWMRFYGHLDFVQKNFTIPDRLPSVSDITEKVDVLGRMFRFNFDAEFLPIEGLGLHVGPYLSYWQMGEAVITTSGDNIPTEVKEYQIKAATGDLDLNNLPSDVLLVNPWDWGITGGLSYDLGNKIYIEAKYEIGLSDLNEMAQGVKDSSLFEFDDNNSTTEKYPPIKFRTLTLGITYWFN
jgi:hypothetical protein